MRVTTFKAHQDPQMLFEGVMIIPHWGSNLRGDFAHNLCFNTVLCVW